MGKETYRASADISHLPTLDDIIQRFHDLLPRRASIQAMDLQDVDISAQSLHARVYSIEDMFPRQANLVHPFTVVSAYGCNAWLRTIGCNAKVAFR